MKQSQPLKIRSCILAVSMLSLVSMTGLGTAADLDQILYASPQQEALRPVEIGSGWYLRGDIAYTPSSKVRGKYIEDDILYTETFNVKTGVTGGGGIGYQFSDIMRGDLTVGYRKQELSSIAIDADIWDVMANGYYDIGNFSGVTPYVGAGLGLAMVDYKTDIPAFASIPSDRTTRLQWALMAGAAIDITENMKLDLGYRYARISSGDVAKNAGNPVRDGGLTSHQLRAGLRFTTW